jgi:hypothetical protein
VVIACVFKEQVCETTILRPAVDDLPALTVEHLLKSGMLDLNDGTLAAPILQILHLDELAEVLPRVSGLQNLFAFDFKVLEELGLTSLYLRVMQARYLGTTLLVNLRPNSFFQGDFDWQFELPVKMEYSHLGTIVKVGAVLKRGKAQVVDVADFKTPGMFYVAATNQPGWDAFTPFKASKGNETKPVAWLTQCKAQELWADTILHHGEIEPIIEGMRKAKDTLIKGKHVMADAIFIFDIFTGRAHQPSKMKAFTLHSNERLVVTFRENMKEAVGEFLDSRKRLRQS